MARTRISKRPARPKAAMPAAASTEDLAVQQEADEDHAVNMWLIERLLHQIVLGPTSARQVTAPACRR